MSTLKNESCPAGASVETFDPTREYSVFQRRLPHWSQAGTITFITWRTWDSMPVKVVKAWQEARALWLERQGISPLATDWEAQLQSLDPDLIFEFHSMLSDRWNDHLDECHGACVLRKPELAKIVSDSLLHFDGDRYEMLDFVVMPNHAHLLAVFPDEDSLLKQCESWKHFTATKINKILGRKERFWQQDGFDHLVRSPEQFKFLRGYIANNPNKANLKAGEYIHYSATMERL